jgi:Endosomal/lysosomal potassium channel TMEM175
VSFYVIAGYWMTHHRLSILLRHVDSTLIGLNLVLLASVVFLPFPTEIMGVYGDTRTAVVFYGLAMTLTGALDGGVAVRVVPRPDGPTVGRGVAPRRLDTRLVSARGVRVVDPHRVRGHQRRCYWWILLVLQRGRLRRWLPGSDEPFGRPARTG